MVVDLAQWRLFVVVAENGSLTKAAEALHTDQPALSRSVRRLEQLIGAPLFHRTSRGLTLTELGTRLLDLARNLVDQAEALESQARAEARRTAGVLKVGALDFYPLTAALAEACQGLVVRDQAVVADMIGLPWLAHARALRDRTIDVGFTLTVDGRLPDPKTMRSLPLWEEPEAFALISEHHPLAGSERIHPLELAELPIHLPDKTDNPEIYNLILELLADAGVPAPRRAPPVGTLANVIQQIAAGNGWSVTASTLARHVVPGTVAKNLTVNPRHNVHFAVVWHTHANQATIATFTRRLRAALTNHTPDTAKAPAP
jgi:DNA-binding transcriptional LysR family regulator